jgi:KDO2-lipid IV(A) lauroyltransferase
MTQDLSATERLSALAYTAAWRTVRWAPEPVARRAFDALADGLWQRRAGGVAMLEHNLAMVLGPDADRDELRRVSRMGTRAYLQYWCDAFRLPSLSSDDILSRVTVTGFERAEAAQAEGRGVVLALPHSGNWDLVGAWLVSTHGRFTTVAERLKPEDLHRRFVAYREGLGMEVLPLTGEAQLFATLASRLRAGGIVCLLGDRDLGGRGQLVDFFGAQARMPAGPSALAVATGAALLPVELWVEPGNGYHLQARVGEEIAVPANGRRPEQIAVMTQTLADEFARAIAARPQDWHMMQRMWVESDATDARAHDGDEQAAS